MSDSKNSATISKTIEKHIELSTTYFKDISNSVETSAEKLADIGARAYDQHNEAKEWNHEHAEKLEEIVDGITTWKDELRIKKDRKFPFFPVGGSFLFISLSRGR
jgi:hypothetical protein